MNVPFANPFDHSNFPPHKDPANEETGMAELYPENLQDQVNTAYNHNKVLPREAGVDYTESKIKYSETQGTTLEKGQ